MWTTEVTLKLIEDLQINNCLWDITHIQYRNRDKRGQALKSLSEKFDVSIVELEKKFTL